MHKSYYLHKRKDRGGVWYVRYVIDKPFGGVEVLPWVSSGETDEQSAHDWTAKNGAKLQPKKSDLGAISPFEAWGQRDSGSRITTMSPGSPPGAI